jgi:phage-related protein
MDWLIEFYIDEKGNEPVKDFILGQDDGTIAEILHVIGLLRQFNINLGMPYVRKIDKSGLRELRIKHGSNIYRIFFFAHTGRKFVLLHAILKKVDKTPEGDKSLAIKRMNDHKSKP